MLMKSNRTETFLSKDALLERRYLYQEKRQLLLCLLFIFQQRCPFCINIYLILQLNQMDTTYYLSTKKMAMLRTSTRALLFVHIIGIMKDKQTVVFSI
jgi:hypothetical protein